MGKLISNNNFLMEYINIFERNRLCFSQEQFNTVINYLSSGSRNDIIEIINLITIQKNLFAEHNCLTDYNLIKHLLLKKLENTKEKKVLNFEIYKLNKPNLFLQINNLDDIEKSEYRDFIIKDFPLIQYCFTNYYIEYNLMTEPVISENYDQNETMLNIKLFLKILDKLRGPNTKYKRICLTLCIYDVIFRNFNLVTKHKKFAKTTYDKIIEFEEDKTTFDDLVNFLEEKNLDKECFSKWKSEIKKVINNNENNDNNKK